MHREHPNSIIHKATPTFDQRLLVWNSGVADAATWLGLFSSRGHLCREAPLFWLERLQRINAFQQSRFVFWRPISNGTHLARVAVKPNRVHTPSPEQSNWTGSGGVKTVEGDHYLWHKKNLSWMEHQQNLSSSSAPSHKWSESLRAGEHAEGSSDPFQNSTFVTNYLPLGHNA